jgi:hypothetical protein
MRYRGEFGNLAKDPRRSAGVLTCGFPRLSHILYGILTLRRYAMHPLPTVLSLPSLRSCTLYLRNHLLASLCQRRVLLHSVRCHVTPVILKLPGWADVHQSSNCGSCFINATTDHRVRRLSSRDVVLDNMARNKKPRSFGTLKIVLTDFW